MSSGFINTLFHLLLQFAINYSSSLHLNASMHSVNMKHILKWSPTEVCCCSTLNYTVQFQGEYELYKLNGTWVDAYDCQEISENRCDLTHDLASNSDYSIRIKANCDGQNWTQLPVTFNRRDTVLLPPKMTVNAERDPVEVGVSTTLSDMTVNLKVWKEGGEHNALRHMIKAYPYHFSIAAHRGEEKMCFRAEALVEAINKSCSTETQCVAVPKQTSDVVKPVIVTISLVVVVAMACILGWLATHFGPQIKQTICHREPIPDVLLNDWPTSTPILCPVSLEPTDAILQLLPTQHQLTELQLNEAEHRT